MAFVNFSILFGGALVAIPIVLHLVMRQQPKPLEFPALRFVKQRQRANRQRLQLRHWLLLVLRCAAIALAALALARPSVSSTVVGNWLVIAAVAALLLLVAVMGTFAAVYGLGRVLTAGMAVLTLLLTIALATLLVQTLRRDSGGLIGDREAPVAAALVLDTSLRMQYVHHNATRLAQAKDLAVWLATKRLPEDSEIAVVDSQTVRPVFAAGRGAAVKRIERLRATTTPKPLPEVIGEAVQLVLASSKTRKEVYVFTDLTQQAWSGQSAGRLSDLLGQSSDVSLQIVDVGVDHPTNFALGDVQLSDQTIAENSVLHISTELIGQGDGGDRDVELCLEKSDPELPIIRDGKIQLPRAELRDRRSCHARPDAAQRIEFDVAGLDAGTHHGRIRIVGRDGLAVDDVRYFTVEVRRPWPVLVAAPASVNTSFLVEALAPYEFRRTGRARFQCTRLPLDQLAGRELEGYAAVFLLDPTPLEPAVWEKLAEYVRGGGNAAIFLGPNARPAASFNEPAAQELLPAKLVRKWAAGARKLYLAPGAMEHQMLRAFRPIATTVPWNEFPIERHWVLGKLAEGASVVIAYSNNKPALVERPLGRGRVLVMTTPISDPLRPPGGRKPWNYLPTGFEPWPFVMLANEMALYMTESGAAKWNYLAGQHAVLRESSNTGSGGYYLFMPAGGKPQRVTPHRGAVTVAFTQTPGAYRLKSIRGTRRRGFSVNVPASASRLDRITPEKLDRTLGPGRYKLARNREEIVRGQGEARVGREFFPLLILMVALVLGLEHLLANRFYREKPADVEQVSGDGVTG